MDNKTMIKVINGMADKIDDLEECNWTNHNRFNCLEDKIDDLKKELDGIYKVLEITDDQIEGLIAYNIKEIKNKIRSK